jgi:hypothetical protein
MNKRIVIWMMAIAMVMGCLSFVSGEEPKTISGPAISMPEIPNAPDANPLPPDDGLSDSEDAAEESPALVPEEDLNAEELPEDPALDEAPVLHVTVPQNLDFVIDPFEIAGRGSVYSDGYPLVNLGDGDVVLTFTRIDVIFANETDFAPSATPLDESDEGGLKTAYLVLDFGNPEIAPIVLTDSNPLEIPSITLGARYKQSSEYALRVTGSVNAYSDKDWQDDDIKISITYKLESIAETQAIVKSPQTEGDEFFGEIQDTDAPPQGEASEPINEAPAPDEDAGKTPQAGETPPEDADLPNANDGADDAKQE